MAYTNAMDAGVPDARGQDDQGWREVMVTNCCGCPMCGSSDWGLHCDMDIDGDYRDVIREDVPPPNWCPLRKGEIRVRLKEV